MKSKAQPPSQGEEKAIAVEPIAVEGPQRNCSATPIEGESTDQIPVYMMIHP